MRLTVGVGGRRGVSVDDLDELIARALADAGVDRSAVAALATVERRVAEPGITAVAARYGWPLVAFPATELAAVPVPNPSAAVGLVTGTPSVAEAAALSAAGPGAVLSVHKRANATATVAIAVSEGKRQ